MVFIIEEWVKRLLTQRGQDKGSKKLKVNGFVQHKWTLKSRILDEPSRSLEYLYQI